jgi:hypothetical protein
MLVLALLWIGEFFMLNFQMLKVAAPVSLPAHGIVERQGLVLVLAVSARMLQVFVVGGGLYKSFGHRVDPRLKYITPAW